MSAAGTPAPIPTLTGTTVRLVPLEREHAPALAAAVGNLWDAWYTFIPKPEDVPAEIDRRLGLAAEGRMVPWTVERIDEGGRATPIGMTTFMNLDLDNRRLEIGSTWLTASAHGTGINPEAKLLLLTHAFESMDLVAVEFRTHWHNRQSRAAIERLGAKQDGVLRNHMVGPDGMLRDTVVFSILAHEWPTVRRGLQHRIAKHAATQED